MRIPTAVYIMFGLGITLGLSAPAAVAAQVPAVQRQPRAAQPAGEGTIQTTAPAPAPVAHTPGQPTVAPAAAAPADPAPVTAAPPPSGVTQLPPAAAPPATASSSYAATAKQAYSAANFSLSLEGMNAGGLRAVEGGAAVGTVVVNKSGPDNLQMKHVSGVRYEPLSFEVGSEAKPVMEWVSSAWQGKASRKSGSVYVADHDYTIRAERQFTNAVITGTTVPALEPGGKGPLILTVTIAPESVRELAGGGKAPQGSAAKAKSLLASNFRFEMGDLETHVKRIESFTVGQKAVEDEAGEMREIQKQPGTLEFPNLTIRLDSRPMPNWTRWREEFLLKGNGGQAQEKDGAIVFLDQTLKNELGRINLFSCGLIRLGGDRQEAMTEKSGTVTADLYCERMELAIKA